LTLIPHHLPLTYYPHIIAQLHFPPSPVPQPPSLQESPNSNLPLHLLYLLSPLAFIQTPLLAHWTGELERIGVYLSSLSASSSSAIAATSGGAADAAIAISGAGGYLERIREWIHLSGLGGFQLPLQAGVKHLSEHIHIHGGGSRGVGWGAVDPRVWLALNGIMAFLLNVVSFNVNRRVGALGMTVACECIRGLFFKKMLKGFGLANVKQVLTILLVVLIFDLTITPANTLGAVLTIIGMSPYAFMEFQERKVRTG
jgi:hypothetical protein